jgi:hypothetical protein
LIVPAADPAPEVEDATLYEVVPEQFVAARDALVKRLRAAGDKQGAAKVAKLRRPPLTTWALNQIARETPPVIEAMLAAGGALRAAMERALDGDASGLRQAHSEDRAAVEAVISDAAARLEAGGYSVTDALRSRMAATLRAATVDDSVAARLRAGTLEQDQDAPGFGIDALSLPASRPLRADPAGDKGLAKSDATVAVSDDDAESLAEPPDGAARKRRQEVERLRADAQRLSAAAEELAAEATRLADEAGRLEAEAAAARHKAEVARREADIAAEVAAAARAKADRGAG